MVKADIHRVMDSPVTRKIISFFHENPSTVDTLEGIAMWIGVDKDKVKESVNELVKLDILIAHKGITTGYGYTQDNNMLSNIGVLLKKDRRKNGRKEIAKTSARRFSADKN